jgi:hypothetical protein
VRVAASSCLLTLLLSSCGYVGPVVPPSPQIPDAVKDLAVVAHGDELQISFTTPARTVDNLVIGRFSDIELRIGPEAQPFDLTKWVDSAREYSLQLPPPNEKDAARPIPISYKLPQSEWVGQQIAVAVRTAVKRDRNYSSWSNIVRLAVRPPLKPPALAATPTPEGYSLAWTDEGPNVHYRIFRQGAADQAPILVATTDQPHFTDAAPWDTRFVYTVVAFQEAAESPASNTITVNQHDKFPPSIPSGLTAVASVDSVELSWIRSPEADVKGYFLYRSVDGAPFVRYGDVITLPAYSDRQVEHGKLYRYQVSSVDQNNNESSQSPPVEVNF